MSLLALLAASSDSANPVGEWPNYTPPADTTPYAFPTSSPYNVPVPAITPTYTGTNEAIHPSVTDFQTMYGMTNWNGYRYWMGMTPYTNASVTFENPSILASHDGYTWVVPNGLTNPITPPASNSDTELEYDPDTGRLWCFWRNYLTQYVEIKATWSVNGTTWTELPAPVLTAPRNQNEIVTECLSPCVLRLASGQWVLYGVRNQAEPTYWERFIGRWTAPGPEGPWTFDATSNNLIDYGGGNKVTPWHIGVVRFGGLFYMLVDDNGGTAQYEAVSYAISADGVNWHGRQQPFAIEARSDPDWDWRPYRATLTPHENGTHMRVWYSNLNGEMGVGYTQIPISAWDGILPA